MYKNRDLGINHIKTRKKGLCSGMGLGILVVDQEYPAFPGDVRNASAFPFPIQYEIIEGLDIDMLLYEEDKDRFFPMILKAAKKLQRIGCKAISAECGYFSYYQKDLADQLDIPVFMSSLLQVPFIQQTISSRKKVGIICANREILSDKHLESAGITIGSNYVLEGVQEHDPCPEFLNLWGCPDHPSQGQAYYDVAEDQIVKRAVNMKKRHPDMAALMLECTGWPPFARTIQREIDMPVYSFGTLFDYINLVVNNREYYGWV